MNTVQRIQARLEAMRQAEAEFDAKMAAMDAELANVKARLGHLEERGREADALLKEWGDALAGNEE